MVRLIYLGILSALFFSSTFVLNRAMGLAGGHWVWTASLRYGYMLLFICIWLLLTGRTVLVRESISEYKRNLPFWSAAGGIGFGVFYALLSFSSSHAPGWVVATAWQSTILASPLVLVLFGRRVPARGVLFSALVFVGIVQVVVSQAQALPLRQLMLGTLPVMGAAVAFPLGNQLVWEARYSYRGWLPKIESPVMDDSIGRVLLLVLGSVPFWLGLILVTQPPLPTTGQLINTATVAILSGVVATSLFLHARHYATNAYQLSAVDATQGAEVLFSLLGEVVFLRGQLPGVAGIAGILLTVAGLVLYALAQGGES